MINIFKLNNGVIVYDYFQNDQLMHFANNDTDPRVFLQDKNQTLVIRHAALEDEGIYTCSASNRVSSAVMKSTLTLSGMI